MEVLILNKNESLYIPANISTRFEFLPGLGWYEIFLGVGAACVAAMISHTFLEFYKGFVVTAVVGVGTSVMFMKNEINMSIADYIKAAVMFAKGQKKYEFVWHDRFEGSDKD